MFRRLNLSSKITILLKIFILILIFSLFTFTLCNYLDQKAQMITTQIKTEEWLYVQSLIKENISKAKVQTNDIASNMTKTIKTSYKGNTMELKYDLTHINPNSKFMEIVDSSISNKYLNVNNGRNHVIVGFLDGIIDNKNSYYINPEEGNIQPWKSVVAEQYNHVLAEQAIKLITSRSNMTNSDNRLIYWEPTNWNGSNEKPLKTISYEALSHSFYEYGLSGLENYNFIVVSYITPNGDILGNFDTNNLGNLQSTKKIFVAQTFNIADLINENYIPEINSYNNLIMNMKEYNKILIISIKGINILFTLSLILLCLDVHTYKTKIKKDKKEENKELKY